MGLSHAQTRQRCDRIREWISLELDCDLSRIERALVDRHVAGCAECREFATDVHAFTGTLRAAPLESLEQPIALPGRVRLTARSFQVAAAAAAAVAVAAIGVASLSTSLGDEQLRAKVTPVSAEPSKDQMRQRQLRELTERVAQTLPRPVGTQPT